jgi:hypothetical protein
MPLFVDACTLGKIVAVQLAADNVVEFGEVEHERDERNEIHSEEGGE